MMITRQMIVAEARRWIDTPFAHQGRLHGVAVDCAGVVEMAAKNTGLYSDVKIAPYLAAPNPVAMREELRRHLDEITFADVQPGDILWFRIDRDGQHLGLVSQLDPMMMIHAFGREKIKRCIEQRVAGFWREHLVGCFRYRGIS